MNISSEAETNSKIVLPLSVIGQLIAVLDINSTSSKRFNAKDEEDLVSLVAYSAYTCKRSMC
ncbi:MAG: hypothetical protein ACFC1C_01545 [Candidatus Malihini olakiniferum]